MLSSHVREAPVGVQPLGLREGTPILAFDHEKRTGIGQQFYSLLARPGSARAGLPALNKRIVRQVDAKGAANQWQKPLYPAFVLVAFSCHWPYYP